MAGRTAVFATPLLGPYLVPNSAGIHRIMTVHLFRSKGSRLLSLGGVRGSAARSHTAGCIHSRQLFGCQRCYSAGLTELFHLASNCGDSRSHFWVRFSGPVLGPVLGLLQGFPLWDPKVGSEIGTDFGVRKWGRLVVRGATWRSYLTHRRGTEQLPRTCCLPLVTFRSVADAASSATPQKP